MIRRCFRDALIASAALRERGDLRKYTGNVADFQGVQHLDPPGAIGEVGDREMPQSEPMLESRFYAWQEIGRMPLEEVLTVIPACHPVWAKADPDLIVVCDQEAAHGNCRAWAKITHHLVTGLKETGRTCVDEELLRWTYSKLSARQPV